MRFYKQTTYTLVSKPLAAHLFCYSLKGIESKLLILYESLTMVISEQIQIYWCFYKEPTPVSDLANNMRFRCNVLISVNCVSINTDPYKNYYATFKREYWHASVHWLYNLKFINCSTKKLLQGLGTCYLLVTAMALRMLTMQSPSKLITSTPYVNCISRVSVTK